MLWQVGRLVWVALLALGMFGAAAGAQAQAEQRTVLVAHVDGAIFPVVAGYVDRAISQAEDQHAEAIVITLDTPGGLDTSMRQIIHRILASRVPVIVYVSPNGARAASAGVYITEAAHVAAMAPGTNIGSATPVQLGEGGEAQVSDEMRAKMTNDAVAYIRGLAQQRGRNADWAEQAVRQASNVTAQQAHDLHVVDLVATDMDDLLRQADGRTVQMADGPRTLHTAGAVVQPAEMNAVESLLQVVTDPTVAYILISLGSLGLFLELSNPGSVLPGVAGGICLLVGLYALGTLPVNYAGLGLVLFGFLLFGLEFFVVSHGILAVGGIVSFAFGSMLLFNIPNAAPFLQISLAAIVAATLAMAGFALFVVGAVARVYRRRPVTGREGMLGQLAEVRVPLDPKGTVVILGERWSAISEGGPVAAGQMVEIVAVKGLTLLVRPVVPARSTLVTPPATPAGSPAAPPPAPAATPQKRVLE